jgi:KipI family sensor histidine kinase inhibitor
MPARVTPLGDSALLVAFEPAIDASLNARVLSLAERVRARRIPGVRDVVPAYASCAVHFDPLRTDRAELDAAIGDAMAASAAARVADPAASTVHIPVCYGGPFGPDLEAVATFARASEDEVVRLHVEREYRVFMIGFLPGFAYLGTVDERIAAPRRPTPRGLVRSGSVGLAGRQTGVYPVDAPGGWQIIGRTPLQLFDAASDDPARLSPGDAVRFVPIDPDEFARTARRRA